MGKQEAATGRRRTTTTGCFDPTSPAIRTAARLVGVKSLSTGNLIPEFTGAALLNNPIPREDTKTSGSGPAFSTWKCRWVLNGGTRRISRSSFDLRFSLQVSGERNGDADFPITQQPAWKPYLAAAYAFDIVCPTGYSSFQWNLQGLAHLSEGSARRYVGAYISRFTNRAWENPAPLSDERQYDPTDRFPEMPRSWNAEEMDVTYPIAPGEALRVFFEYGMSDTDTGPNTRWNATFDAAMSFVFLG